MAVIINGTTGITYPAGGTDNVASVGVGTTDVQTLTNKTITMGGLLNLGSIGQIQFPATMNASSNANTLDDYEEGTWSPTWWGASGSPTYTAGNTAATYVKIGRLVMINISNQWSGKSVGSGTLGIALPFPVSSTTYLWSGGFVCGFSSGLSTPVAGTYTDPGASYVFFKSYNTTTTLLQVSDMGTSGHVMLGGCYLTD